MCKFMYKGALFVVNISLCQQEFSSNMISFSSCFICGHKILLSKAIYVFINLIPHYFQSCIPQQFLYHRTLHTRKDNGVKPQSVISWWLQWAADECTFWQLMVVLRKPKHFSFWKHYNYLCSFLAT